MTFKDRKQLVIDYIQDPMRKLEIEAVWQTHVTFFMPTEKFIARIKTMIMGDQIVECGCGLGQCSHDLRAAGIKTIALDIFPSDNALINDVIHMDAVTFPFGAGMIGLIARPNRGDWVQAAIIKAVEGCGRLIYVGKSEHFMVDVKPLSYRYKVLLRDAGRDGETAWLVSR